MMTHQYSEDTNTISINTHLSQTLLFCTSEGDLDGCKSLMPCCTLYMTRVSSPFSGECDFKWLLTSKTASPFWGSSVGEGEKVLKRGTEERKGGNQAWCNKKRRKGHLSILTSLKRSWHGWQDGESPSVLCLTATTHTVTGATSQATSTETTRQFWGLSVCVLHFAEILCQTLSHIVTWISRKQSCCLSSCHV